MAGASCTLDVGSWLSMEGPSPSQACGLFVSNDISKALPLRSRSVSATIYAEHGFCEVQEQLAYVSNDDCTVRFVFPLPPRSAVYKFEAMIGDRKVVTEVKRKAAAREEYDTAVRQGHSAVHMQQQAGASLYSVEVGNLCAMEEAVVTFSYVRLLNSVAGALEFEHQATWVPPYFKASDLDATGQPNKVVASANPVFADKVTYTLSYRIKVQSSRGFRSIESPTTLSVTEEGPHVRLVTLDESVSDPSRDLTLLVELPPLSEQQAHTGQLLVQECDRQGGKKRKTMALATFIPRLPKTAAQENGTGSPAPALQEIIFVVDGSGSMGGSPIQQALEAALFFVKDLPTNSSINFNAAVFGSSYQLMWPASKPYSQATQQEATRWLQQNVHANWGGTEVLSVLQAICNMPLTEPNASRQILFLTDGGVSGHEEQGIYDLVQGTQGSAECKAAAKRTSIYSLGIGHGVHRGLVEGVATKTGGLAQFVVDGEAIGKKAGLLKRCALAAEGGCLTQPRLVTRSCMIRAAPHILPPRLFGDEPLHVLAHVVKAEPGACLELTGTAPGATNSTYSISLPLDSAVRVPGDVFAVLHAMCSIGGLLGGTSDLHCRSDGSALPTQPDDRRVEDAVVALAEEEGLVTPHTSAVGVLLQKDPVDPDSVRSVEVPLQVPAGRSLWGNQANRADRGAMGSGAHGGMVLCMSQAAPALTPAYALSPAFALSPADSSVRYCIGPPMPCDIPKSRLRKAGASFQRAGASLYGAPFRPLAQIHPQAGPHPSPAVAPTMSAVVATPSPVPSLAPAPPVPPIMPDIMASIAACSAQACSPQAYSAQAYQHMAYEMSAASPRMCLDVDITSTLTLDEGMIDDVFDTASCEMECEEEAEQCEKKEQEQKKKKKMKSRSRSRSSSGRKEQEQTADCQQSVLSPQEVLSLLNLRRSAQGSVASSQEVLQALAGQVYKLGAAGASLAEVAAGLLASGARPAGLTSDDAWVTVLALAYLRKHLASEQSVWSGLEAKALEWLGCVWSTAIGKSVGSVVLAAMKVV